MEDPDRRAGPAAVTGPPPAEPGAALADVDTPALVVDLDAFEGNLEHMARLAADAGVRLRPHAKTHKCPAIAQKQVALGAVGVCCQKVSEAEIMVAHGIEDVFVSNEIAGGRKLARLAALAREARVAVCVDDLDNVGEVAAAAEAAGARLFVFVEIEVGAERCGAPPGEPALRIAAAVARESSLRLAGLQAYHGGAQHFRDYAERRAAIDRVIAHARGTAELFRGEGLPCEVISGAGTGTFEFEAASGVFNEIQPGSYVFMDADYARNRGAHGAPFDTFDHALFVLATVMSRPAAGRAVVDAGHKAASVDSGPPEVFGRDGVRYTRPSDEHGVLVAQHGRLPARGDRVLLIPGHCDPTVNLHDWLVCVRGLHRPDARVEDLWPVSARGALF